MLINRSVLDDIVAHARESRPRECCGLLTGKDDQIVGTVRARNVADLPTRFLIDPHDHLAALRSARSTGLDVVGFYHSHPHSGAYPSPTDLAEATYPEAVHLIVGLKDDRAPEARLFRIAEGGAEELELEVPAL